jgi:hypothetical protein
MNYQIALAFGMPANRRGGSGGGNCSHQRPSAGFGAFPTRARTGPPAVTYIAAMQIQAAQRRRQAPRTEPQELETENEGRFAAV